MNLTKLDDAISAEIPSLVEQGVTTLKSLLPITTACGFRNGDIFRALRIARNYGMLVLLHAENGDVIEVLIAEAQKAGHWQP